MVKAKRSPYLHVASYEPSMVQHVEDIICQKFEATQKSDTNIRFTVRSPGPRSLMDSEVLLVVPMTIRGVGSGGAEMHLAQQIASGGEEVSAAVAADGYTNANLGGTLGGVSIGENKNVGFCERFSGFWRGCDSVTVEVNGTQISIRPDEFLQETDILALQEPESWPNGPMDSGSNGCFLGKAYKLKSKGSAGAADYSIVGAVKEWLDEATG